MNGAESLSDLCYIIAFGGNLGEKERIAQDVLVMMNVFGRVGRQSRQELTRPLLSDYYDTSDHGEYLNFVFEFRTELKPRALYQKVKAIEDHFGRDRSRRWLPRAVDLDLLLYARADANAVHFDPDATLFYSESDGDLRIPHPALSERAFLMTMIETDLGLSVAQLIQKGID